jgi:hypothetical protein
MGKFTNEMVIFNSKLLNCQRVDDGEILDHFGSLDGVKSFLKLVRLVDLSGWRCWRLQEADCGAGALWEKGRWGHEWPEMHFGSLGFLWRGKASSRTRVFLCQGPGILGYGRVREYQLWFLAGQHVSPGEPHATSYLQAKPWNHPGWSLDSNSFLVSTM